MRSRNIKPGFFKNEDLAKTEPHCRLLFAGLWGMADRDGRLEDRPERIRAELFPYEPLVDINGYLTVLSRLNMVIRYRVGKQSILQVSAWSRHQSPHSTERKGDLPEYIEGVTPLTVNPPLSNGGSQEDSLIPDSLIPVAKATVCVSGEETALTPKNQNLVKTTSKSVVTVEALQALKFLNQTTGKNFRAVDVNLGLIQARLDSGVTLEDIKTVVVRKWRDWKDRGDMQQYLRPETLFGKTKFEQYLGEIPAEGGQNELV